MAGSLSGWINGGAGTNTLTSPFPITWTFTTADSGTVTGVAHGFRKIQNVV
jgi:hypothetical protein